MKKKEVIEEKKDSSTAAPEEKVGLLPMMDLPNDSTPVQHSSPADKTLAATGNEHNNSETTPTEPRLPYQMVCRMVKKVMSLYPWCRIHLSNPQQYIQQVH